MTTVEWASRLPGPSSSSSAGKEKEINADPLVVSFRNFPVSFSSGVLSVGEGPNKITLDRRYEREPHSGPILSCAAHGKRGPKGIHGRGGGGGGIDLIRARDSPINWRHSSSEEGKMVEMATTPGVFHAQCEPQPPAEFLELVDLALMGMMVASLTVMKSTFTAWFVMRHNCFNSYYCFPSSIRQPTGEIVNLPYFA